MERRGIRTRFGVTARADITIERWLSRAIHGRRFQVRENTHGVSNSETTFEYRVDGDVIEGNYSGGGIARGQVVGVVASPDEILLRFQCVTASGELMSGPRADASRSALACSVRRSASSSA